MILEHNVPGVGLVTTLYGHIDIVPAIRTRVGSVVPRGTCLGQISASVSPPHLHFGIRVGGYDAVQSIRGALDNNDAPHATHSATSQDGPRFPEGFVDPQAFIDLAGSIGRGSSEKAHFMAALYRGGGAIRVGRPINDAHWWGSVVIQDYRGGTAGDGALIDNEGTSHGTAWWLHGEIWKRYAGMGGPSSALGKPLSDEQTAATSPRFGTTGVLTRFERGSIYHSGRYGAFAVWGRISGTYEQNGGTGGRYGFPRSSLYMRSIWLCQDFEGGTISILGGN